MYALRWATNGAAIFFLNELKITHEDTQFNPNPHTDGYGQIYEREEQKNC